MKMDRGLEYLGKSVREVSEESQRLMNAMIAEGKMTSFETVLKCADAASIFMNTQYKGKNARKFARIFYDACHEVKEKVFIKDDTFLQPLAEKCLDSMYLTEKFMTQSTVPAYIAGRTVYPLSRLTA